MGLLMVVKALSLAKISWGEDVGRVRSKGRAWGLDIHRSGSREDSAKGTEK